MACCHQSEGMLKAISNDLGFNGARVASNNFGNTLQIAEELREHSTNSGGAEKVKS